MRQQLAALLNEAKAAIAEAADPVAVERLRVQYLGKKGQITALLKTAMDLPAAERPEWGKIINQAKQELQALLDRQDRMLGEQALKDQLQSETVEDRKSVV